MTSTSRPVVVGYDGKDRSRGALRFAMAEARRSGAPLRVVRALAVRPPVELDYPPLVEELEAERRTVTAETREELERLGPGLEVDLRVDFGSVPEVILEQAAPASLVVLGTETAGPLRHLVGGATSEAVARRSPAPVALVPAEWADEGPRNGRTVAGLKDPTHAGSLLQEAFEQVAARGGELHLLHAWSLPGWYDDRIEARTHLETRTAAGERLTTEAVAPWRAEFPEVPVTVDVVHGDPGDVLVTASAEADLVLLLRDSLPLLGPHLGHVARTVVERAQCPVLVVPARKGLVEPLDLELEKAGELLR